MVDLSISGSSHQQTLRGLVTEFHGLPPRYGNIAAAAAAGDRKLILELSLRVTQPEMCHLNMTNSSQPGNGLSASRLM